MNWYKPRHVTQRDPTDPKQFSHCWAAVGAWGVDGATNGASRITAKEFARAAGGGSGRKAGSGTQEDILKGLDHYGVKARILRLRVADLQEILSAERRGIFAIPTDYDIWPAGKDCMRGEAGPDVNHEVGVIGGATLGIMNPLCDDYQSIPLATLMQAAAKYARQQGHSGIIEVVRVLRQEPPENDAAKKLIAQQRDKLDAWQEYHAATRELLEELQSIKPPK